jgi:hypothetical protein
VILEFKFRALLLLGRSSTSPFLHVLLWVRVFPFAQTSLDCTPPILDFLPHLGGRLTPPDPAFFYSNGVLQTFFCQTWPRAMILLQMSASQVVQFLGTSHWHLPFALSFFLCHFPQYHLNDVKWELYCLCPIYVLFRKPTRRECKETFSEMPQEIRFLLSFHWPELWFALSFLEKKFTEQCSFTWAHY